MSTPMNIMSSNISGGKNLAHSVGLNNELNKNQYTLSYLSGCVWAIVGL